MVYVIALATGGETYRTPAEAELPQAYGGMLKLDDNDSAEISMGVKAF